MRISTERGPAEVELSTHLFPVRSAGLPAWTAKSRGEVRLRVDMPATNRRFLFVFVAAVLILLWLPAAGWSLSTHAPALAIFTGVFAIIGALVFALMDSTFSRREVLEIDSRFVTVTRGDTLVGTWARAQFTDVRLNDVPPNRLSKPWWPAIVWATGVKGFMAGGGATGPGLSQEEAVEVLERIRTFCEEYAPDPDAEMPLPGFTP